MPNKGRKSTDFVRHFSILITFLPNAALRISCSINNRKIQPAVTGKLARNSRTPGQTKTTPFYLILSTPAVKSNARGPQSRQKTGFPTEFCLPLRPNPHTAPQSANRVSPPLHAHPKNPHKKRPDTMPGLISLFN